MNNLKSEDLVKAYIDRIKAVNPLINALICDRFAAAIEEANRVDSRVARELAGQAASDGQSIHSMPLLGVPFSVKECIAVKDMYFTAGLYSRKGTKASDDSRVIQNIRDAGAIPIGMYWIHRVTNIPEFLLWWDSYNKIYGRTNNPYDKSRISGGSSGGEAALIAAAGSLMGVGTDLGGSIRIPAHFCGIFGHKPTTDIVPVGPQQVFPDVGHPDREKYLQIGPLCRYASDLRPMLKACAGKQHIPDIDKELDLTQLKVYYMEADGDPLKTSVSPEIKRAMRRVVRLLDEKTGRPSERVFLSQMKSSLWIWLCTLANVEAPYLSEELTERTGRVNGWSELSKWFVGQSRYRISTSINVILYNFLNPRKNRDSNKFQKLVAKGDELRREINKLLGENGILLYPTLPESAPKHNGTLLKSNNVGYTMIFNITGHPVTQVPIGLTSDGLPVGLQVVSMPSKDHLTIGVAELLEKELGGWTPPFDVQIDRTLRLKCEATQPIHWSFPDNDPSGNSKCQKKSNICVSNLTIKDMQFWQTGNYSCHYNTSKHTFDSIYVFVNDPNNLIVPIDGSDEFIIVPALENSTHLAIPCRPTSSNLTVTLDSYDSKIENFVQMSNDLLSFDPTIGFTVHDFPFSQYNTLDCKVKSGLREQYIGVTVHQI
ncbi:unnamed protein product, partial [Medioppia subpectinata]